MPAEPVTSPEGFVGELRSYQAEALAWLGFLDAVELGGCLALDMGLGKTPTVLAHLARTPGNGPGARHRPARRRRQLGGRGGPVHARACGSSSTTAPPGPRPTSWRPRWPAPTSSSPPTAPPSATSRRWPSGPGTGSSSTRPRPSRTRPTRRPSSCAASRPAPASRSPARRSRTASATCGRSSTSPTRASSAPGPRSSPSSRARARRRCGRSTASSCSAAPRASRWWPPSCPTASTSSTTAR